MGSHTQRCLSFHKPSSESHQQDPVPPGKPPFLTFWNAALCQEKQTPHLSGSKRKEQNPQEVPRSSVAPSWCAARVASFRDQHRSHIVWRWTAGQVGWINKAQPKDRTSEGRRTRTAQDKVERLNKNRKKNIIYCSHLSTTLTVKLGSWKFIYNANFCLHLKRCY